MAYLDDTGLAYFWGKIKAWANSVFSLLGHTHPASDVTAMTGYSMPSSTGAISSGDTLNQAVGKLEKAIDAADISNVVHRTGDEDVAGKKFFQNAYRDRPVVDPDGEYTSSVFLRAPTFDKGDTTRTAYEFANFVILDRTGSGLDWDGRLATLEYNTPATTGAHGQLKLSVYKNEHPAVVSGDNIASLYVGFDANDVPFAQAPSTSALRNVGGDIVTRNWIPNDTRIVHTTGNETISGLKTFNQYVTVNRVNTSFAAINPELTFGQNPSADKANILRFITSDNHDYGGFQSIYRQNGETLTRIYSERPDGGDGSELEVNNPATGAPYACCPSTPDPTPANLNGRTYNKSGNTDILTRDWIPRDTRIVHANTSVEAMTGNLIIANANLPSVSGFITDITKGTAPSSSRFGGFYILDSTASVGDAAEKRRYGLFETGIYSDGSVTTRIRAYKSVANSTTSAQLSVTYPQSGDPYATAPTPAANDNSTKIATTEWTRTFAGNTYLPLSGGTMTGSITMSNGNLAKRGITTDSLSIHNGTSAAGGGGIWMYGKDNAAHGEVRIQAYNGTYRQLNCLSDGTLKWNGQTVQTTSDERLKTPMSDVPDEVLDAWGAVRWGQFQFLDAVEEKGSSARLHVGLIAQAVDRTFALENLDVCRYGILCHEVRGAEGEVPAVEQWMARYTEALCMEAAYQRRENARLKKRVADLEERLAALELRLGSE